MDSTYQHLFGEMLKTPSSFSARIPEQKEKPLSPPQSRRGSTRRFLCLGMLGGDSRPSRTEQRMRTRVPSCDSAVHRDGLHRTAKMSRTRGQAVPSDVHICV